MPAAAHGAEFPCPAVLLDMPEGLTLEAPQWLGDVPPHRVYTPRTKVKGVRESIPERHQDLAGGFPAAVTRAVSHPPCEGDTRVSQDGVERETDWESLNDTAALYSNLIKG